MTVDLNEAVRVAEFEKLLPLEWRHTGPDYTPVVARGPAVSRGEVWTAAGGSYAGKPRPVVIVQDGAFGLIGSVTVCPMTTLATDATAVRVPVEATAESGLNESGFVMVDKIMTLPRGKVRRRLGKLSGEVMRRIDKALQTHLFG